MKATVSESVVPSVEMVPFPQIEELPPLPPAPDDRPVSPRRMRGAYLGEAIAALGALAILFSLFVSRWYHVGTVSVQLGGRQTEDSYVGEALASYANDYSLAVWAFLKRGYAIAVISALLVAAVIGLVALGRQRRSIVALIFPCALAAVVVMAFDLRHVPVTLTDMAKRTSFATAVQVHGLRPGLTMFLAYGGLLAQIGGALVAFCCLPHARRQPRGQRQPKREKRLVQPRAARRYAVEGGVPLPRQAASPFEYEGRADERP